jgi:ADP-ribose pyrophosphatase YjhB (NUDIX family)
MRKVYIALFFEDTVYLIREPAAALFNDSMPWKFPGGTINPNETLLEGGFRIFAIKTGQTPRPPKLHPLGYRRLQDDDDEFNFNLEEWARQTNHTFTIIKQETDRTNPFKPVEKTYFYCICRTKPQFVFRNTRYNRDTENIGWYNINRLPSSSTLRENVQSVVNSVKHLRSAPLPSAPPIEPDDFYYMQASAPPMQASSLPMQASAPPLDDFDNDELPYHLRNRGGKKIKRITTAKSSKKYKHKFSRKYKKISTRKSKKISKKYTKNVSK